MSNKHYSTIIIGATFYGCGYAASSTNSLILESSNHVGSDYVFGFNPGKNWESSSLHKEALEFKDMLLQNNGLKEQKIHTGVFASLFSKWCLNKNLNIELLSTAIDISNNCVEVLNPSGKVFYNADNIIDARPNQFKDKLITALISHDERNINSGMYNEFEIISGLYQDESYLLYKIPSEMNWPDARNKLYKAWKNRCDKLNDCKLAFIGTNFDYMNFDNPLVALHKGLNKAK